VAAAEHARAELLTHGERGGFRELRATHASAPTATSTTRFAAPKLTRLTPGCSRRAVSFYGGSVRATLALLCAETRALAGRVRGIGGEAPWADLERVNRLATTGYYGSAWYATAPPDAAGGALARCRFAAAQGSTAASRPARGGAGRRSTTAGAARRSPAARRGGTGARRAVPQPRSWGFATLYARPRRASAAELRSSLRSRDGRHTSV
jgi:hypothetical protein